MADPASFARKSFMNNRMDPGDHPVDPPARTDSLTSGTTTTSTTPKNEKQKQDALLLEKEQVLDTLIPSSAKLSGKKMFQSKNKTTNAATRVNKDQEDDDTIGLEAASRAVPEAVAAAAAAAGTNTESGHVTATTTVVTKKKRGSSKRKSRGGRQHGQDDSFLSDEKVSAWRQVHLKDHRKLVRDTGKNEAEGGVPLKDDGKVDEELAFQSNLKELDSIIAKMEVDTGVSARRQVPLNDDHGGIKKDTSNKEVVTGVSTRRQVPLKDHSKEQHRKSRSLERGKSSRRHGKSRSGSHGSSKSSGSRRSLARSSGSCRSVSSRKRRQQSIRTSGFSEWMDDFPQSIEITLDNSKTETKIENNMPARPPILAFASIRGPPEESKRALTATGVAASAANSAYGMEEGTKPAAESPASNGRVQKQQREAPPVRTDFLTNGTTTSTTPKDEKQKQDALLLEKEQVLDTLIPSSAKLSGEKMFQSKNKTTNAATRDNKDQEDDGTSGLEAASRVAPVAAAAAAGTTTQSGHAAAVVKKKRGSSKKKSRRRQGQDDSLLPDEKRADLELATVADNGDPPQQQPGAVLVRGDSSEVPVAVSSPHHGTMVDAASMVSEPPALQEAQMDYYSSSTMEQLHHVSAVAVDQDEIEDSVRRRILQGAALASVVNLKDDDKGKQKKRMCYLAVIIMVLLGAIIGLSVGLTRGGGGGGGEETQTATNRCDTDDDDMPKSFLVQCQCDGMVSNVPPQVTEAYSSLEALMELNVTEDDQFACDTTQGAALWWLANDTDYRNREGLPVVEHPLQRLTLAMLYVSTHGLDWLDQGSWMTLADECEWAGVMCNAQGQVNQLDLSSQNLRGPIVEQVKLLTEMTVLRLQDNSISGTLPIDLFKELYLLQHLDVSFNNITGQIPHFVDIVELFGVIQEFLAVNPNVTLLELLVNPGLVGAERSLFTLNVANNIFTGTFPQGIELISTLRELRFDNNKIAKRGLFLDDLLEAGGLTSAFPVEALGLFSELEHFSVRNNPDFIFRMYGFQSFRVYADLEFVDITNTSALGAIPSEIGTFVELEALKVGNTDVNGTVPSEILNCVQLQFLELQNTQITGTMPDGICDALPFLDAPLVSCNSTLAINCSCCECV